MSDAALVYDRIGPGYSRRRAAEPAWVEAIREALSGVRTLVNVGAGTGSYEPAECCVVAIEPSLAMIRQRPPGSAPVIRGIAEALPFADGAFDAALAVLTVHHWQDVPRGLAEMRRVARRQVVLTWDPDIIARDFWLVRDYLPEIGRREAGLATLGEVAAAFGPADVRVCRVPAACVDGFLCAYWRRPYAYLDPEVRSAISGLALLDASTVEEAMTRLAGDLHSGAWARRNAELLSLPSLDLGYRLVVAGA